MYIDAKTVAMHDIRIYFCSVLDYNLSYCYNYLLIQTRDKIRGADSIRYWFPYLTVNAYWDAFECYRYMTLVLMLSCRAKRFAKYEF